MSEELRRTEKFYKGPILEATPPFETGCSLNSNRKRCTSTEFRKLQTEELPLDRNLYLHQEMAVRKLVEE